MPKAAKKKEAALADRLRDLGLPKQLAKSVARTATNVKGQLPDSARSAIRDMIAKVEERGGAAGRQTDPSDPEDGVRGAKGKRDKKGKKGKKGKAEKHKQGGKPKAARKAKKVKKSA
jgi:hypothetical protein